MKVRDEKYSCRCMFLQNLSLSWQIFCRSIYFFVGQKDKPCSSNLKCSSDSLTDKLAHLIEFPKDMFVFRAMGNQYRVLITKVAKKFILRSKSCNLYRSYCLLMKSAISSYGNGYSRWRIVRFVLISFFSKRCFL